MSPHELCGIIANDKQYSLEEIEQIIYELRQDCLTELNNTWDIYYQGEMNAFQIALDLLSKVKNGGSQ